MKLLNVDYILVIIIIILIYILYITITILHKKNNIYNRKSILTNICNKEWKKKANKERLKILLDDKLKVKEFNSRYFSEMKCAKTIIVFDDINDFKNIEYQLPDKYVVKFSMGTGFNIIVDTKISSDKIISKCKSWPEQLKNSNSYKYWYNNSTIIPKFFIEEYIGNNLIDYKFFTYKGNIMFLEIDGNRYGDTKGIKKGSKEGEKNSKVLYTIYDDKGQINNKIWIPRRYERNVKKLSNLHHPLPNNYNKMKEICKRFYEITKISFCRIDFYEINNELYFGEYTFIPNLCEIPISTNYEQYLINKYNI